MENTLESQITIETLPPMRVASLKVISSTPEGDSIRLLRQWLERHHLPESQRIFGFDVDVSPEDTLQGKRGYETWMPVPDEAQPSEDIEIKEFAGGSYAALTLVNPFVDAFTIIPSSWKRLHEWVIGSKEYMGAAHQWLEELLVHPPADDLKLYHPIAQK
jgi:DNA gyrase inhibitor GyrI